MNDGTKVIQGRLDIRVNLKDALRLLFTGRLHVHAQIKVDKDFQVIETRTTCVINSIL